MKFTSKQANILFVFLVSLLMTAVMSFAILTLRVGLQPDLLGIWVKDFATGCLFSVPTGFLLVPLLKKWIDRHTLH